MCEVVKTCHEQGIVLRDLKLRKFVFADAERWVFFYRYYMYAYQICRKPHFVRLYFFAFSLMMKRFITSRRWFWKVMIIFFMIWLRQSSEGIFNLIHTCVYLKKETRCQSHDDIERTTKYFFLPLKFFSSILLLFRHWKNKNSKQTHQNKEKQAIHM